MTRWTEEAIISTNRPDGFYSYKQSLLPPPGVKLQLFDDRKEQPDEEKPKLAPGRQEMVEQHTLKTEPD